MDIAIANECWQKMLSVLRSSMGEVKYNTWFKDLTVYSADEKLLVFTAKEAFTAQHVRKNYIEQLFNMAPSYFGIEFEDVKVLSTPEAEELARQEKRARLNPKYTFETFIVGQSNLLAHAASVAVAECPGKEYNPLFIYGGAGLGKTHLMTAIANYVNQNNVSAKIEFSNSEKFTNEVVEAIRTKHTQEFRNRMRSVDVLFIDDIQFLAGRTTTQEEFFNTFNELYSNNKQIVISSDRNPDQIATLEERMRSRFKSGLVVGIEKPDTETRMAILTSKAADEGITIEDEAVYYIAERVDTNIRELEGALTSASLMAKVMGSSVITGEIARASVKDVKPAPTAKTVTPEAIIQAVARRYGINPDSILSSGRSREITVPRQLAMYLVREICSCSTTRIGEVFGRDHSTVMHACKKAEEMLKDSREFAMAAEDIRADVT